VRVGNRTLFEVLGDGKLTAGQRADRINRRLQTLIERRDPVPAFTDQGVKGAGDRQLIRLGGEPVMEVTPQDAEDNFSTPRDLALSWGRKMAAAVADARAARSNPLRGAGILMWSSITRRPAALRSTRSGRRTASSTAPPRTCWWTT